jgi:multimeric flavodoxin WrbA
MTVLGISGSPRKGGCSEILLDAALEPLQKEHWDVKRILMSQTKVEPCTGCLSCLNRKTCFLEDGMQEIYDAFYACDALIISAPVYWRSVPAQLKAVFDRTFGIRDNGPLKGKLGGAIAVGGAPGGGQSIVLNEIYNFYLSCGALCVPGQLNGVSVMSAQVQDTAQKQTVLELAQTLGRNILAYALRGKT